MTGRPGLLREARASLGARLGVERRRQLMVAVLLLLLGQLFAGAFLHNLGDGLATIRDPNLRQITRIRLDVVGAMGDHRPIRFLGAILLVLVALLNRQGLRLVRMVDLMGSVLLLRCASQLVILNLLLLAPMRHGGLLLVQLALFVPVITLLLFEPSGAVACSP